MSEHSNELFSFSDSFKLLVESSPQDTKKLLKDMLLYYKKLYGDLIQSQKDDNSVTYSFLMAIDEQVQKLLKAEDTPPTCKKGCHFCCYQRVAVSKTEMGLIIKALEESKVNIDIGNLMAYDTNHDRNPYELKRCPLLGADNSCIVYEYRPAVCRILNVKTESSLCDIRQSNEVQRMIAAEAEAILAGMWSAQNIEDVSSIQELLLKGLKP